MGEGQGKQQRNANSSGGVSIPIVVAGPQVEQNHHARAGKRGWIHREDGEKKREQKVQSADVRGLQWRSAAPNKGGKPEKQMCSLTGWWLHRAQETTHIVPDDTEDLMF